MKEGRRNTEVNVPGKVVRWKERLEASNSNICSVTIYMNILTNTCFTTQFYRSTVLQKPVSSSSRSVCVDAVNNQSELMLVAEVVKANAREAKLKKINK